jgi:hypothetical protein
MENTCQVLKRLHKDLRCDPNILLPRRNENPAWFTARTGQQCSEMLFLAAKK